MGFLKIFSRNFSNPLDNPAKSSIIKMDSVVRPALSHRMRETFRLECLLLFCPLASFSLPLRVRRGFALVGQASPPPGWGGFNLFLRWIPTLSKAPPVYTPERRILRSPARFS